MTIHGTTTRRPGVQLAAAIMVVLASIYLFKTSVLDVLAAAHRHEPSVSLGNGSVLAPISLALGLVSLMSSLAPERLARGAVARFMSDPATGRISRAGMAVVVVLMALGLGLHLWLRAQLQGLGYDV